MVVPGLCSTHAPGDPDPQRLTVLQPHLWEHPAFTIHTPGERWLLRTGNEVRLKPKSEACHFDSQPMPGITRRGQESITSDVRKWTPDTASSRRVHVARNLAQAIQICPLWKLSETAEDLMPLAVEKKMSPLLGC